MRTSAAFVLPIPDGDKLMSISVMQVFNHSDEELRQLEGYVGRVPAFDR